MKMKTTKFLAVLAVLVMAFAAFAVAIPETDASAASFVDTEQSFKIKTGTATTDTQTVKVYALNTATVKKTSTGVAFSGYMANTSPNFGLDDYAAYAEVELYFGNMSSITTGSMKIEQKTTFAPLFAEHLNDRQSVDADKTTMTSIFDFDEFTATEFSSAAAFGVLVPQDGSSVELTITTYSGDADKTTAHAYACTGDKLGSVTYVLDFSSVTTVVELGTTAIGSATDEVYYDGSGKLTLNGAELTNTAFSRADAELNVILTAGSYNSIEAYTADSVGVISAGALTIKDNNTDRTAITAEPGALVLEQQNPKGFGISGSSVTIGDTAANAVTTPYTEFTSTGGAQAIYSATTVAICNADIEVSAGERGIRATTDFTATGYNYVEAEIDDTLNVNGQGTDDIWGIKVGGSFADSANTGILTEGLRVIGSTFTRAGALAVSGDYIQNLDSVKEGGLATYVSGLYLDAYASSLDVKKVEDVGSISAAGLYFVGDVDCYVPSATVTVTDESGNKEVQANATSSTEVQTAITSAPTGTESVIVNVTAAIADLNVTTKAGQILELRTTTDAAKLTGKITLTGAAEATNTVNLNEVQGAIIFGYGSIVADVIIWTDGDIVLGNNDVLKISGSEFGIAGDVTVSGPTGEDESAKIIVEDGQTLIINEGCSLTITGNVSMNNDGAIVGEGIIYVDEDATFYTSKPVLIYFEGDGTIITEDAMETLKISDKLASSLYAHPTQKVLVTSNLAIKAGQYLVVTGELEIPEGVTVTIEEGGLLMLEGPAASAVINGTIKAIGRSTSTEFGPLYAAFTVASTVTGDIDINGEIIAAKSTSMDDIESVDIAGNANIDGKVTINPKAAASFGQANISEYGQLINNGTMSGTVFNAGTVIINGSVDTLDSTTIYMRAADAVVDVQALKYGELEITDEGMYLITLIVDGEPVIKEVDDAYADINTISLVNASGLKVTEDITYGTTDLGIRYAENITYVEGTIGLGDSKISIEPTVSVDEGAITVATTLDIVKAKLVVNADLNVYGTITVDNSETYKLYDNTECTPNIIVAGETSYGTTAFGLIQVTGNTIEDEDFINAVLYEERVGSKTVYYYTNLTDAIASGAKDFEVLGILFVNEDTTIPAGISVDAAGHLVYVGDADDYPNVTLTVSNGGSLSAGTIYVDGTLYIANTDSGISCNNIISDTSNIGESDALYTNIYKALTEADSGDVVKITKKDDGSVYLEKNATVKEGVTLLVPASKNLYIMEGVTLTVNGFLQNKGTIDAFNYDDDGDIVEGTFAETAKADTYAAIKVNGMIESMSSMPYTTYKIAGAYYTAKTLYYISTVEAAALLVQSVDSQMISIYGTIEVDDVAFIGSDSKPVTVYIYGNAVDGGAFTTDTVTYSNATISVETVGMAVNGTFSNTTGSVTIANMKTNAKMEFSEFLVSDDDETVSVLTVAGSLVHTGLDVDKKNAPKVTFEGAALIRANLTIDGLYDSSKTGSVVFGTDAEVLVLNGAALTIDDASVTINGSLIVADSATMNVTTATSGTHKASVTVNGIFTAADDDDEVYVASGAVTVDGKVDANAGAIVGGNVAPDLLTVYPGAIIVGELLEKISKPSALYTNFYVEGDLWKTVYLLDTTTGVSEKNIQYHSAPGLKDCVQGKDTNGYVWYKTASSTTKATGTIGDSNNAYAYIIYDIYKVEIYTDAGVKSVSIDGKVLVSPASGQNLFYTVENLKAGNHKVTYTLKDGYSGEAILYTSEHVILPNLGFETSGTDDYSYADGYKLVKLELSGTEPTPEPEPVEPEKESEWTITTILLCVLVVLIAIMAVIVALRLNRN